MHRFGEHIYELYFLQGIAFLCESFYISCQGGGITGNNDLTTTTEDKIYSVTTYKTYKQQFCKLYMIKIKFIKLSNIYLLKIKRYISDNEIRGELLNLLYPKNNDSISGSNDLAVPA